MFDRALDRVSGRMHASLHARAHRRLPELVHDMMEDAVGRWALNGWERFDQREVNCTIQLYRWLRASQRADTRFNVLEVGFETVIPTPGMLNATESVTTAARSDLRIYVRGGAMVIEAKRLMVKGKWCKEYVDAGMARFVDATYAAAEDVAMMIGYVQQPSSKGLRERVNRHVAAHSLMGAPHELIEQSVNGNARWLHSSHQRSNRGPIDLRHLWIVLPESA